MRRIRLPRRTDDGALQECARALLALLEETGTTSGAPAENGEAAPGEGTENGRATAADRTPVSLGGDTVWLERDARSRQRETAPTDGNGAASLSLPGFAARPRDTAPAETGGADGPAAGGGFGASPRAAGEGALSRGDMEELDRFFRRDSRRYDGGFDSR